MPVEQLIEQFRQRDRRALARLLTLAARGEQIDAIRSAIAPMSATSRVIAVTGSGGVGKSTLIGALLETIRNQGRTVAVLACDPESPLTGGALLGDRLRMPNRYEDEGVYIRSVATAGGRQAVPAHLDLMLQILAAFGFDIILAETVGAGQGDTAVRQLADLVVLLLQPEAGDDVQWEKAGLLEVADVVVIHKADLPGADRTEAQVRSLLNLPGCREVPVVRVSAAKKQGLDELYRLLLQLPSRRSDGTVDGRELLRLAQQRLAERFDERRERIESILARLRRHEIEPARAVEESLQALVQE